MANQQKKKKKKNNNILMMFKSVLFNDFESMLLQKLNLIFRFQKNHDFSFFTLAADLQLLAAPGPVSEFLNAFSESLLAPP